MSLMDKYGHLVQTEWDRNFLNTAHFAKWFDAQQNEQPIQPGVLLVNYVRERIDAQNKAKAAHQQAQQAVADAHAQAQPQSQAQAGQVSQAQSNSNGGLFGGGGQNNGQPAPYLSTASHIYPNEGMGTVNPAALSGQASPATNGSVSTAPLKQQQVKKEAVKPTSRESTPAPTSAPNKSKLEPVPTLEWDAIQPSLTAAIRDDKLIKTPTVAANYLAKTISAFNIAAGRLTPWGDTSYVPPTGRIEVLKQLNRRAGLEFFQAWLRPDAAAGMEVFAGWLTGSVQTLKKEEVPENETKKDKAVREHKRARAKELEPVLGPLMVTLSKIPFTLDHLRIYRIGPAVKRVASKAPDSSTRKVAEQLVDKWTKMQNAKPSDVKDPKRKADLADGPNKKPKPTTTAMASTTTKPAPAKVAPKPAPPTSMFASTTPLPSFKRATPAATPAPPKIDAFAAALKAVERTSAPNNAAAAQGIPSVLSRPSGTSAPAKDKKPKKSVRWRADEELVASREIEWRGDPLDERGNRTQFGVEDGEGEEEMEMSDEEDDEEREEKKGSMAEQEGASMLLHLDEEDDLDDVVEAIEWYTPTTLELPPPPEGVPERPEPAADGDELVLQPDQAEQEYPPTPQSPTLPPTEPEPTFDTKLMKLSDALAKNDDVQRAIAAASLRNKDALKTVGDDAIANLLGKLQANGAINPAAAIAAVPVPVAGLTGLDPAALAQLGSQLNLVGGGGSPMPPVAGAPYVPPPQQLGGYGYAPGFVPNAAIPGGFPPPPQSPWMLQQQQNAPGQAGYNPISAGYGAPPPPPPGNPYGYAAPAGQGQGQGQQQGMYRGKRGQPPPGSKRTVCRYFKTRKGCDWGKKCPYLHE